MDTVKVGVCGLGTVGSGTVALLTRNASVISARAGKKVDIIHIGARRDNPNCNTGSIRISRDIFDVARDPDVQILVELIGGTTVAKDLVLEAIAHGKHVVTANKALIAEFGGEIFAAAAAKGVTVAYEAAVAGGIPIIRSLREGLGGNKVKRIAGIINGTGNFILTEMATKGRDFADVLKEAQALGYAEADPTFDVEGIDAAHKLVILASIAFGIPLQYNNIYTQGISDVSPLDLSYANDLGYAVKHLGIACQSDKGIELRVHPTMVPHSQLIAKVDGVMNAVMVEGDAVGPTMFYGAGAGAEPTASAVVGDVLELARMSDAPVAAHVAPLGVAEHNLTTANVLPMAQCETGFYLRFDVKDEAGVLSKITGVCSDMGISVESLIQKEADHQTQQATIVMVTHRALESDQRAAIAKLAELDVICGDIVSIRVEDFDQS